MNFRLSFSPLCFETSKHLRADRLASLQVKKLYPTNLGKNGSKEITTKATSKVQKINMQNLDLPELKGIHGPDLLNYLRRSVLENAEGS